MKKAISVFMVMAFVCLTHGAALCQMIKPSEPKKAQKPAPAGLSNQERAAVGEQALALLTGKVWTVFWSLQGAHKPVIINDELTFTGNGVSSKYLVSKGFSPSQYSMRVHDDRVSVWETVQQNFETGDMAMLRGEIRNGDLLGTITMRTKAGLMEIYSYGTSVPPQPEVPSKAAVVQKEVKKAPAKAPAVSEAVTTSK